MTFTVYFPDRTPVLIGLLIEELSGSGVYVNKSKLTKKRMDLPKGIYLVCAHAETWDGYKAIDMIQFHIDQLGESESNSMLVVGFGSVVAMTFGLIGFLLWRRKLHVPEQEA